MKTTISSLLMGCIAVLLGACDTMPSASDAPATYLERYQRAKEEIEKAKNQEGISRFWLTSLTRRASAHQSP